MKDKDLEKSFREFHNDGLEFTEEDKKEVFRKIDAQRNRKSSVFFLDLTRRAAPLMAMAVLLTLSIVLAYSLIGDENSRNADQADKETAVESNDAETLLFLLKNEDERTDLHLLISYSKQNGSINLATLPRDTYVPIIPKRDGEPDMEKLTHINAYRDGGESVKKSVSTALDLPIDYHVTVDENDFVKLMNTIGETNLNLDEKKSLLSTQDKNIKLPKGPNYLDGDEAVALLATSGAVSEDSNEWSEDDRLKLSEAVMKNLLSHVRPDRINTLLGDADTNADFETIIGELAATQLNAMRTISIEEQVKSVWIDETYYLQFKEGSESWLKSELLRFD